MIPKVIHQIWLGPEPLAPPLAQWSRSWGEHHPDWTCHLWTTGNLPPLVNQDVFDRLAKLVVAPLCYGLQADLARYELLARFGGVYTDVDNECIRPLDDLMENQSFVVAAEAVFDDRIPNDFIAARRNHPLLWDMIRLIPERARRLEAKIREGGEAVAGLIDIAGPRFLAELVSSGRYTDLTVLPHQLIHPWRRWLPEGNRDYAGVAYVRNHYNKELSMWRSGGRVLVAEDAAVEGDSTPAPDASPRGDR